VNLSISLPATSFPTRFRRTDVKCCAAARSALGTFIDRRRLERRDFHSGKLNAGAPIRQGHNFRCDCFRHWNNIGPRTARHSVRCKAIYGQRLPELPFKSRRMAYGSRLGLLFGLMSLGQRLASISHTSACRVVTSGPPPFSSSAARSPIHEGHQGVLQPRGCSWLAAARGVRWRTLY
jgi:hypothetical protein